MVQAAGTGEPQALGWVAVWAQAQLLRCSLRLSDVWVAGHR